jgi:hypothetical protein
MENVLQLITQAVSFFKLHGTDLVLAYTSLVTAASIIVKITPTLKDDNILLGIVKFLGKYIALNRTVNDEAKRMGQ